MRNISSCALSHAPCVVRPFNFKQYHLRLFKLPVKLRVIMNDLKWN
jgi:hypothetical protein